MLAILLAAGLASQTAAWAIDALALYVSAHSLELSLVTTRLAGRDDNWVAGHDELLHRFGSLPGTFPHTKRYAKELFSGTPEDRFAVTLNLILDGLPVR